MSPELVEAAKSLGFPVVVGLLLIVHFIGLNRTLTAQNQQLLREMQALRAQAESTKKVVATCEKILETLAEGKHFQALLQERVERSLDGMTEIKKLADGNTQLAAHILWLKDVFDQKEKQHLKLVQQLVDSRLAAAFSGENS